MELMQRSAVIIARHTKAMATVKAASVLDVGMAHCRKAVRNNVKRLT